MVYRKKIPSDHKNWLEKNSPWRTTPTLRGYAVSATGLVKDTEDLPVKLTKNYSGYIVFEADGRQLRLNREVCRAFHGEPPKPWYHSAHKDGNKENNHKDNLYWATPQQNSEDLVRHNRQIKGEEHPKAVITEEMVRDIRKRRKMGWAVRHIWQTGYSEICCEATISHIACRRTWKHVSD